MHITTSTVLMPLLASAVLVGAVPPHKLKAASISTTSKPSSSATKNSDSSSSKSSGTPSTTKATSTVTKLSTTISSISTTSSIKTSVGGTTTASLSTPSTSPTSCAHTGKRGLAYNDPKLTGSFGTCNASSSKINWAYNWASDPYYPNAPNSSSTYNTALRFVPMLWSNATDLTSIWARNIAAAKQQYGSDALLAFNEPDGCDGNGACMSVADSVTAWRNYIQPNAGSFLLGAPAVTNGQGSGIGLDWLASFVNQCTKCTIDFIPLHFYGDVSKPEALSAYVSAAYQQFGKPIWLTEFGATSGNYSQVHAWASSVMSWLDAQSYVARYAYLMDAIKSDDTWLIGGNGSMNAMGLMYNS